MGFYVVFLNGKILTDRQVGGYPLASSHVGSTPENIK